MSSVNIVAVNVLNNPAPFSDPVAFEIQYEAIEDLEEGEQLVSSVLGGAV